MIARGHLTSRRTLPPTAHRAPWVLDSGGFNEVTTHGRHRTPPSKYAREVRRFLQEMPGLIWAAAQDYMCENIALHRTGLTVRAHQHLTVANLIALLHSDPDLPWLPVIQGRTPSDYLRHIDEYARADIDILDPSHFPHGIGIGSICRLQSTPQIATLLTAIRNSCPNTPLHGFGVKSSGLKSAPGILTTADSAAWSRGARINGHRTRCRRPTSSRTHSDFSPQNCPGCAFAFWEDVHPLITPGRPPQELVQYPHADASARPEEHDPTDEVRRRCRALPQAWPPPLKGEEVT